MFVFTINVEDKHLAEFLHRIGQIATIHSISGLDRNADGTKLRSWQKDNGEDLTGTKARLTVEQLAEVLRKHNLVRFKGSMFKEILKDAGYSPMSYGYYLKQLHAAGLISKLGKGMNMTYQLNDAST